MMEQQTSEDPRVERSRAAVLKAAVELLLEGGINAVTVEAVSKRSGVAKTTIYRHWDDRDALVVDTFRACIPTIEEPEPELGFEDALRAFMRSLTLATAEPRFRAALPHIIAAQEVVEELGELQDWVDEQHFAAILAVLQRGIEEGDLPADIDLTEAKHQLYGPLISTALETDADLDEATADRIVDLFLKSRAR